MTRPFENMDELRTLLNALCEEKITAEQVRRLEELVLAHPEAEAFYVQYMSTFADLSGRFGGLPMRAEHAMRDRIEGNVAVAVTRRGNEGSSWSSRLRFKRLPSRRALVVLAAAVAAAVMALVFWPWRTTGPENPNFAAEAVDHSVAVLVEAPGAEWENGSPSPRAGAPLQPGWLRLTSGLAQVEFYCGAVVILEGPVEFQLISRTEAYCSQGKLRATVPAHAQGFTIGSPKVDLVDRGTEFGLQVGERTEVHVFRGKVELHEPGADTANGPGTELKTGQSVRVEAGGMQAIKSDPASFRTLEDLATRAHDEMRRRQMEWDAVSRVLRQDPSLLVYFTFQAEEPWRRTLVDQAGRLNPAGDGAIVGCSWTQGRWPGRQGLEFKRVSDRVRVSIPGEFESLSFVAWVRVDALPNVNNALMMTDGWETGAPHWQIGNSGTIILGVKAPVKVRNAHYHAPGIFTPERFGQWVHLAVVYDGRRGLVTHYVDGQAVAQESVQFQLPLRIGKAEIGNWNVGSRRASQPVRYFTGCMDEFLLFSRPLSEQEIERMYIQGRPAV
jgi:hypothetical protein